MNCIYICVLNEKRYLDMFYLLLESIYIYGNLDNNIDILINTTNDYINMIKEHILYNNDIIKFEINDNIEKSEIFDFDNKAIKNYEKILYLETSIIVKDDINKLFEICNEEEDIIRTTGVILFKNSDKINKDKINNEKLKSLIGSNNDSIIDYITKEPENNMIILLNKLKDLTINENIEKTKEIINNYLLPIINNSGELLEGNIFMQHQTCIYTNTFINKQKNISYVVLNKNIKNVMEIGFNSGFSTLLMLISNPNINITCYDIGEHKYTIPCYEKLKELFKNRINLIIGDSSKTLLLDNNKYDVIHIDGGHAIEIANSDIQNSYRLSKDKTILIMDDYDCYHLHHLWNIYVLKYKLKSFKCYYSQHHDIKYV
jgi:predicted O-methyltransferase YrrM